MARGRRPLEEKQNKKGLPFKIRIERNTDQQPKTGSRSGTIDAGVSGFSADTGNGSYAPNFAAGSGDAAVFSAGSGDYVPTAEKAARRKEKKFRLNLGRKGRKAKAADAGLMNDSASGSAFSAGASGFMGSDGGFGAMIRSADPILRLTNEGRRKAWKKDILLNIACAALLTAFISLFVVSIDEYSYVIFALPCAVVFLVVSMIESIKPGRLKWIVSAVIALVLLAVFAIWHTKVLGGLAMLMNMFYEYCEDAQAYLYTRFAIGDSATVNQARIGMAWASSLTGLIAALSNRPVRKWIAIVAASAAMLMFAYYGLLPSWVCIMVIAAALVMAVCEGGIVSALPLILVGAIVFSAMYWFDPGELYPVSRADENVRDRIALRTAQLESVFSDEYVDPEQPQDEQDWETPEDQLTDDDSTENKGQYGRYVIIAFIVLLVLALALAGFIIYRRIARKRAKNREGLTSRDPRTAVVAMFPYTAKWLAGYGIEQRGVPFPSMVPALRSEFSDAYAERYMDMYKLWSEAAYSDHDVMPDTLRDMDIFMQQTIKMIEKKCSLRDKLRIRLKYAL